MMIRHFCERSRFGAEYAESNRRNRLRHITVKGQDHDPNIFEAHYLDNGCRYGLVCTYRKWLLADQLVTWSMMSRNPERSSPDPKANMY